MTVKFLLARHGQTTYNLEKRFYGASDSPLTDLGRQQALQVAEALRSHQIQPDLIVASDLSRTRETAQLIIRANGWQQIPFQEEAAFREIDFGRWEGLTADEIQGLDPKLWQAYLAKPLQIQFPQGESYQQFQARIIRRFHEISWRQTNLIIGHLGVLRSLVKTMKWSMEDYWELSFPQGSYRQYE